MDVNDKVICTIVAKNYTAFARTLCESFTQQHPAGKSYVLVIDDVEGFIDTAKESFDVIKLSDLNIPNVNEFCFKYNITELSTAVKPYLLEYLFNVKCLNKVIYFDPDILITGDLTGLYDRLEQNDYILTPHLNEDYPDDGLLPNDAAIMTSGVFNLGFIGLRNTNNSLAFLRWWQKKLSQNCIIDHANGYFVDQKFIDLAITLFPTYSVINDVEYNVAYWNLHSRSISFDDGEWFCNGRKLRFFHFSNYKPELPDRLSGHQTRFNLADMPALRRLFQLYTQKLIGNGYKETRVWPYSYATFSNGETIIDAIRKTYRQMMLRPKEDPFNLTSYSIYCRILFRLLRSYKKCTKLLLSLSKPLLKKLQISVLK